jgi:hypothetical protein
VIDVTDRTNVAVRLVPLKLRLRHGVTILVILSLFDKPAFELERVKGIEPSS